MGQPPGFTSLVLQLARIGGSWASEALETLAEAYGGLDPNKDVVRDALASKAASGDAGALELLIGVEGGLEGLPRAPWLTQARSLVLRRVSSKQLDALEALLGSKPLEHLQELDLSVGHCGDEIAAILARTELPALTTIRLEKTGLTDKGIRALAKRSTPIRCLEVGENKIGPAGLKSFGKSKSQHGLVRLGAATNKLKRKGAGEFLATPGFAQLRHLDVCDNDIGADFMAHLLGLGQLESLDVAYNQLGGELLALFKRPPPLKALRLDGGVVPSKLLSNTLRGDSPLWETLESLSLHNTSISNAEVTSLLRSPKVRALLRLTLPSQVEDACLRQVEKGGMGDKLRELRMQVSALTEAGVASLQKFKALEELDLSGGKIGDAGAAALAGVTAPIRVLRLRGTGLTAAGAESLAAWEGISGLQRLEIDDNELGDAGALALASALPAGTLESLRQAGIGSRGLEALLEHRVFEGVEDLDLSGNALDDEAVAVLASSPGLETLAHLDLSGNPLGDGAAPSLAASSNFPELAVVSMESNTAALAGSETLSPVLRMQH